MTISPGRTRLQVLVYDSFAAKGGLGPAIVPAFEKRCRCDVKLISVGDGGQLVSRLQLDAARGKPSAQVVVGLDQVTYRRAKPQLEAWGDWKPKGYGSLRAESLVEPGFLPFDYGVLALMADREALKKTGLAEPTSLAQLVEERYRRKLLVQDPRTSTPGLGFYLFVREVRGKDWEEFWKRLSRQWLTLAPGWDSAYALFTRGEAPLVWSYTTSQAYHEEHGDGTGSGRRYAALVFEEGNPLQIEGAALVLGGARTPGEKRAARDFLEFLISEEAQAKVPRTNWMFPARDRVALPSSFLALPKPSRWRAIATDVGIVETALRDWDRVQGVAR